MPVDRISFASAHIHFSPTAPYARPYGVETSTQHPQQQAYGEQHQSFSYTYEERPPMQAPMNHAAAPPPPRSQPRPAVPTHVGRHPDAAEEAFLHTQSQHLRTLLALRTPEPLRPSHFWRHKLAEVLGPPRHACGPVDSKTCEIPHVHVLSTSPLPIKRANPVALYVANTLRNQYAQELYNNRSHLASLLQISLGEALYCAPMSEDFSNLLRALYADKLMAQHSNSNTGLLDSAIAAYRTTKVRMFQDLLRAMHRVSDDMMRYYIEPLFALEVPVLEKFLSPHIDEEYLDGRPRLHLGYKAITYHELPSVEMTAHEYINQTLLEDRVRVAHADDMVAIAHPAGLHLHSFADLTTTQAECIPLHCNPKNNVFLVINDIFKVRIIESRG